MVQNKYKEKTAIKRVTDKAAKSYKVRICKTAKRRAKWQQEKLQVFTKTQNVYTLIKTITKKTHECLVVLFFMLLSFSGISSFYLTFIPSPHPKVSKSVLAWHNPVVAGVSRKPSAFASSCLGFFRHRFPRFGKLHPNKKIAHNSCVHAMCFSLNSTERKAGGTCHVRMAWTH